MYYSRKLDVKRAPAGAVLKAGKSGGAQEAIMKKRRFGKALGFFAVVFGLTLAGCTMESDNNGGSGTTKLVEGEWTDGKISEDGQTKKYTFEVSKGARYFIWLNDSEEGDKTKTANVGLKISHEDGTVICDNYNNATSLYTKPLTFLASSDGTITIVAASRGGVRGWENGTGSYAIKYTSRVEYDEIFEETWKSDTIIATGQTNKYTFTVTEKTRYFIWVNDSSDGDTTKTADVGLKISHNDGTVICDSYSSADDLYKKPLTFLASSSGTITIVAASRERGWGWENGTGTYAIKYTSRPEYDTLSEGIWKDDTIIATGQTNKYYISVISGKTYKIYLDDTDNSLTAKTADVGLKIFYEKNGAITYICDNYNKTDSIYTNPYTITADHTGTITIVAASRERGWGWESGTGTYAIKYTIGESE